MDLDQIVTDMEAELARLDAEAEPLEKALKTLNSKRERLRGMVAAAKGQNTGTRLWWTRIEAAPVLPSVIYIMPSVIHIPPREVVRTPVPAVPGEGPGRFEVTCMEQNLGVVLTTGTRA
jgi:hypothetical protein